MERIVSQMTMIKRSLILAILLAGFRCTPATPEKSKFKAAVYSHAVILPPDISKVISRKEALVNMNKNLDIYNQQAKRAKLKSVNIIVFPEDGLYGFLFKRDTIYPYLEYIPDPRTEQWSPCLEPDRYPDTEVQYTLSCMAKENNIYLVANMGDKQPCEVTKDTKCPPDGRYQYNTNVVYAPDGTLVARYHKYHLFYEPQFDVPELEIITFNTPFGKFGLMVCFDVLFRDPGLNLVSEMNVSNIVFPTAWRDALPLLSAIGFHSSFARGLGINFLSANIHLPTYRFHGSGIYTPDGALISYYGATNTTEPKLLVADVNILEKTKTIDSLSPHLKINEKQAQITQKIDDMIFHNLLLKNDDIVTSSEDTFQSYLFYDLFTFVPLTTSSGYKKVYQGNVRCELKFSISEEHFGKELYAFGAFDGLHTYEGQYYFQICALVKCADANNRSSCGAVISRSTTTFLEITMAAIMQTPYIYPQIVLSDDEEELHLADLDAWTYANDVLSTSKRFNGTVLSAALFGRYYSRDNDLKKDKEVNGDDETIGEKNERGNVASSISIILKVTMIVALILYPGAVNFLF